MQRDVIFSHSDGQLTASIRRDVDHHSARAIREAIDIRLNEMGPDCLILDFSGVDFMDSSGLGLILGRAEAAAGVGARLVVIGMSPSLYRLIRLSGIERVPNVTVIKEKEGVNG